MSERAERRKKVAKYREDLDFRRTDAGKLVRLKETWRKPKGRHNKMREGRKGTRRTVKIGYRTPKDIRGISVAGWEVVRVFNVQDVQTITKDTQAIQIASTVGGKKREAILGEAKSLGLEVVE